MRVFIKLYYFEEGKVMAINKNQHYVSAFYLYNFTNEDQKKLSGDKKRKTSIWHFDKNKGIIKERAVANVATKSYLFSFQNDGGDYDHSLDEELRQVESRAANAFSELSGIVSSFKKRSTRLVNVNDSILNRIIEFTVWQMRRHPDLVDEIHQKCKSLCEEKNWKMTPKEMALDVISGFGRDDYSDFSAVLKEKNKTIIFTSNDRAGFITTDEPFVRFNKVLPDGIGHESTEIYFPLASNMLLYLQGNGDKKSFRLENDRKFLRRLNVYLAQNSKNYIFGNTREQLESIVKRVKINHAFSKAATHKK